LGNWRDDANVWVLCNHLIVEVSKLICVGMRKVFLTFLALMSTKGDETPKLLWMVMLELLSFNDLWTQDAFVRSGSFDLGLLLVKEMSLLLKLRNEDIIRVVNSANPSVLGFLESVLGMHATLAALTVGSDGTLLGFIMSLSFNHIDLLVCDFQEVIAGHFNKGLVVR